MTLNVVTAYDAVRGSPNTLRSSRGDFTAATATCEANDRTVTSMPYEANPLPTGAQKPGLHAEVPSTSTVVEKHCGIVM